MIRAGLLEGEIMELEYVAQSKGLDRRVFVRGIGFVSLGLLAGTMLGGCETLLEQIRNRPTRRRLRTGSAEVDADIETYREAVRLMKELPASDPRSWSAQAGIHGTVSGGFNFCQHGTDHFFSWHRAYLSCFEKICQELTGRPDFGLPYWNWNQDPAIHSAFTDTSSPLFHARNSTTVSGSEAVASDTLDTIFADGNFFTFASQLEGTPHNTVHVLVGADMVTGGSAGDPVFWMHHCMIDYCWAKWNLELENDTTNDPDWISTSWDHFVDGVGAPTSITAGITTLMPLLTYQYEPSTIGSSAPTALAVAKADFDELKRRIEAGAPVRLDIRQRVSVAENASISLRQPLSRTLDVGPDEFAALLESDSASENVFAAVEYARLPPRSDFFVRVFVGLPGANPETPVDDPHYAGSFAFFGTHSAGHGGHHHAPRFLVNLNRTLGELRRRGEIGRGKPLSVQLVAVPVTDGFQDPDAELQLTRLELLVTPLILRKR
jgi:tyrosinase